MKPNVYGEQISGFVVFMQSIFSVESLITAPTRLG